MVPPFAALMIAQLEWRTAFLVVGAIVLAVGGAAGLFVTSPSRGRDSAGVAPTAGQVVELGQAIRSRPFLLLMLGFLLASFGQFTPMAHLVPYAEDRGITPQAAAALLSLLGIGSAVGRFAIGAAADRIGRWRGLGLSFRRRRRELHPVADRREHGHPWVYSRCWWGRSGAGPWRLAPSVMADYFGTRAVSGIIGVLYTGVGLGAFIGPIMAGVVFDLWESYVMAILFSIICPVLAAVSVLLAEAPERWRQRLELAEKPRGEIAEQTCQRRQLTSPTARH